MYTGLWVPSVGGGVEVGVGEWQLPKFFSSNPKEESSIPDVVDAEAPRRKRRFLLPLVRARILEQDPTLHLIFKIFPGLGECETWKSANRRDHLN